MYKEKMLTDITTYKAKSYGLAKTHKNNIPFRIVVSCINS